jgi:small subunit ribosomal protein S8
MMTDSIADMLTRIRNAVRIERPVVDMPFSSVRKGVAEALKSEGYIFDFQVGTLTRDEHGVENFAVAQEDQSLSKPTLRVILKYGLQGERVIQDITRVSKPGCRVYRSYKDIRPVLDGLGVTILSTSQGIMSDRQAKKRKVGGEVLCTVW